MDARDTVDPSRPAAHSAAAARPAVQSECGRRRPAARPADGPALFSTYGAVRCFSASAAANPMLFDRISGRVGSEPAPSRCRSAGLLTRSVPQQRLLRLDRCLLETASILNGGLNSAGTLRMWLRCCGHFHVYIYVFINNGHRNAATRDHSLALFR